MRLTKVKRILLIAGLVIFGVSTSLFWYFQKPFSDMMISVAARSYEVEGRISYKSNDLKNAFKCFDKVVELEPQNVDALLERGTYHASSKNYVQAIADFSSAIKLDPKKAMAYAYRAQAYSESGQLKEALADCETLIRLAPSEAEPRVRLGLVLSKLSKFEDALASYNKAVSLNPDYLDAYRWRGWNLATMGKYIEARNDFRKLTEIDPYDAFGWFCLAKAETCLYHYDEALKDVNRSIELKSEQAESYYIRGLCHLHKGNYKLALVDFDQAEKLDKHPHAELYVSRAEALTRLGQTDKARENCERAIQVEPNTPYPYIGRGMYNYEQKKYSLARQDFNTALKFKDYALSHMHLSELDFDEHNYFESLRQANLSIRLEPNNIQAHLARAKANYKLGSMSEAHSDFNLVIAECPELRQGEAFYYRSLILKKMNKQSEASTDLESAKKHGYKISETKHHGQKHP